MVLRAGGLPAAVPWVGWRGLRDARFKPEAAAGEAFFLEVGGEPCRWLPSGGRLHGGCVLPSGGRSGWTLPRSRRWLTGIGPARGLRSNRMPQRGRRSSFRPVSDRGSTSASALPGCVRPSGEGRRQRQAQVQDEPRRNRPCPELSFGPEAATGVFVRLEGLKPAALTSGPEGRGWIWPSRGRCCTHRGPLAGGTNEDAHAPTTTPSPAGRSASSSEALPFLPDRSASERALRCGVAVDGGYAAVGWWSRIGGGAAVWSRPVGCGKCRRTAQVGLPRLSPSLCFERWAGRALCLGRWMGVCLRLHPGRWPQGEGRSAVWCGGRWRVLPLGRMKRGGPPGRGRPGDADVDQGDMPASPGVSGCRGDGVRPCGWGAVG
ncbi:hypothetical protein p1B41 (plasmid) [Aromatoleum aromaticum EbN1]|uniref:Uncharacterized protein n=1 Tax=Aromatoleum aromaticum (strain DSM 19018 / LMG 30748 / EbN1) TaxID=76114 RepID=Q5NXD5_AROAE|nr:hypothetical protein p1B41 [Aromatoleum aromaticum EbN1]